MFRTDKEPFVAASGARIDEIIRAVRACPSGALSFAIEGHEERDQPLQREGVRFLGAGATEVRVARLGELSGGDQGLGLGEGARALEGEEQLLVEQRRRRQRTGGEA